MIHLQYIRFMTTRFELFYAAPQWYVPVTMFRGGIDMKRIAAVAAGLLIASLVCPATPRAEQAAPNAKGPKVTVKTVEAQVLALQAQVAALHNQDFAVVAADGTLARGSSSVVSSAPLFAGAYEVIFNKDVSGCAFVATIGTTINGGVATPGEISVAGRTGNVDGVFVSTQDSAGANANNSFHLSVSCP